MDISDPLVENLISRMEHYGYYLLPRAHPGSPGYTGLLVAMRSKPTEMHFDPELMELQLFDPLGAPEEVKLTLQSMLPNSHRVCPGPISLRSRRGKEQDFFTFGGSLEIVSVPGETVYTLRSSGPVLELSADGEGPADQLAAEFDRVMGELRAQAGDREERTFARLAHIDPLRLYSAAIHSILEDYDQVPSLRASFPELSRLLHEEREWLQETEQWPPELSGLDHLLGLK